MTILGFLLKILATGAVTVYVVLLYNNIEKHRKKY